MLKKEGYIVFETIRRLYKSGKLSANGVTSAVEKGWITPLQADKILDATKNED